MGKREDVRRDRIEMRGPLRRDVGFAGEELHAPPRCLLLLLF